MTKEQFTKRIKLIQNFHSEQETLSVLIDKLTDGYSVVTIGNYIINEMITMIEEDMGYKEILEWWFYEDVEKRIGVDNEWVDVDTPEKLYDFIIKYK